MKVISWKSELFFTETICSSYKEKHNAIWSKAISMPLTI